METCGNCKWYIDGYCRRNAPAAVHGGWVRVEYGSVCGQYEQPHLVTVHVRKRREDAKQKC